MAEPNLDITYTVSDIDRYLSGRMSAKEMHDMERAALQDPFLADAIEGYREADKQQSERHLNEIAAAIQGERAETKIISLPGKKSYVWQIAAAVILVIGVGFVLYNNSSSVQNEKDLASNDLKKEKRSDSVTNKNVQAAPLQADSITAFAPQLEPAIKQPQTETGRKKTAEKNKAAEDMAVASSNADQEAQPALMAPKPGMQANDSPNKNLALQQRQAAPVMTDTMSSSNLSEVIVTAKLKQKATNSSQTWTNDKGKPFRLSDVEVITLGKKENKPTDTSAVKPEGGWQSFREYLFSRLSKKDTLAFMNSSSITGNLELEFSFDETGSPFDITVAQARDSATVHNVISAMQNGPKWLSSNKKAMRLRITY